MADNRSKYWMVHCAPNGTTNKRHEKKDLAELEAQRLAQKHPNQIVYVLETVSAWCTEEPRIEEIGLE